MSERKDPKISVTETGSTSDEIRRLHEKAISVIIANTPNFLGLPYIRKADWEWAIKHLETALDIGK